MIFFLVYIIIHFFIWVVAFATTLAIFHVHPNAKKFNWKIFWHLIPTFSLFFLIFKLWKRK